MALLKENRAQAVIELSMILSVAAVAIILIYSLYASQINAATSYRDIYTAKSTVQRIASAANSVYASGMGSEAKVLVEIPMSVDLSASQITGKTVLLKIGGGGGAIATSDVNISGAWKPDSYSYYAYLYYDGNVVQMTYRDFEISNSSIYIFSLRNKTPSTTFNIRNSSNSAVSFWLAKNFSYSEVSLEMDPSDYSFNLAPGEIKTVALNFDVGGTAFGNYSGAIDVVGQIGDSNLSKTVFVSVEVFSGIVYLDTNWQTSWITFDANMSAYYKRCSPSTELCFDGVDNDCDGLTDCADAADCPSSLFVCRQPVGVLASTLSGDAGQIAVTSATTNYYWQRVGSFVIRNNSDHIIGITRIDINGSTNCINRTAPYTFCNGTPQIGTASNENDTAFSALDPTTGECSGDPHGWLEAGDVNFVGASNPWSAVIGGGVIDLYSRCTRTIPNIVLKPGEETGVLLENVYPDWCLGSSWAGQAGKQVGLKIYFADGSFEYVSDLNTVCRQSANGYVGMFSYIWTLGFGSFPNAWTPTTSVQGSPPTYKVKPSDQSTTETSSGVEITGLGFNMAASKAYGFNCHLTTWAGSSGWGIRTSMSASQAADYVAYTITGWSNTSTTVITPLAAYDDFQDNTTSQGDSYRVYEIRGSVLNGGTASDIYPVFKSESGGETTVKQGSWCVYTTLGN